MRRALATAAVLAAALGTPAVAATSCVGEQSLAYACVTRPDVSLRWTTLCVYAGGEECQRVPFRSVEREGRFGFSCEVPLTDSALGREHPCAEVDRILGGIA